MTLEQIEKICDKQGFWVNKYDDMFGKGKPGWEIGQMSSCGEDWFETFEADDVDTFIANLESRIDNWDSEEEALPYIERRGQNGVPSSIRDLLDDADWKEEQLKDLLDAIKEAPDEEDELEESKDMELSDDEKELDKLQNELRGVKVAELSDEEYTEFQEKAKRVNELINKIYKISKLGENKKQEDEDKTKIIFRKDKEDEDIIAVFAEDIQSNNRIGCYAHLGQHATMSLDYYNKGTTPATPEEYADLKRELESIGYNVEVVTELNENKKLQEDDVDLENSDDVDKLADEVEPTAVDELIEEWEAKSPLHERVISEIVEDSEGYDGETLKERVLGRLGDIANGLVNGTVGSLIYYSDTVKFFDDYYDDIWDVIQDLVDNGLEPLEAIKEHCDETEILMCSDTVKNWVAWMVYEEIAYMFRNELEDVNE